jgi:integrase
VLTVQQARQKAIRLLAAVQDGKDPAQERCQEASAPLVADLAERYMRDHAEPKKKARSVHEDRRLLDKHILPVLGARKVGHVTSDDIDRLHASMSKTPILANRVLALLSMMLELAGRWGMRPKGLNPARGVACFKERRRERHLSLDEISRLGDTLREMEQTGGTSSSAVAGIRLLLLSGARRSEIRWLRWENVDLERRELHLEDSKTGPRTILLNAPALEVLAGLDRSAPWVLPATRGDGPVCLSAAWTRIRKRAGLEDVRLHDLRHSFASVGAGAGLSLWTIGKVLGHTQPSTTARYAHADRDPVHAASEQIASRIAAALDGGSPAEVVELAR